MTICTTLKQRDSVKNQIMCQQLANGDWKVYQVGDEALLPVVAPVTPSKIIPANDFRNRFTSAELVAINQKAYVDNDANVQMLLLKVFTEQEGIDLNSAETIGGVNYLVAIGVILAARKADLLG